MNATFWIGEDLMTLPVIRRRFHPNGGIEYLIIHPITSELTYVRG